MKVLDCKAEVLPVILPKRHPVYLVWMLWCWLFTDFSQSEPSCCLNGLYGLCVNGLNELISLFFWCKSACRHHTLYSLTDSLFKPKQWQTVCFVTQRSLYETEPAYCCVFCPLSSCCQRRLYWCFLFSKLDLSCRAYTGRAWSVRAIWKWACYTSTLSQLTQPFKRSVRRSESGEQRHWWNICYFGTL